jgi:tRNA(Ile)-lysidine synthetase-like protein
MTKDPIISSLVHHVSSHPILKRYHHQKIAIACSGGKDSMALAFACDLLKLWEIEIFTVDHGIHALSQQYAQEIKMFWDQLGIHTEILKADPMMIAQGQGIEDGARKARYFLLSQTAKQRGCSAVLLGHHALDQVETILMRLNQASGLNGLKGIPEQRDIFIRPMLSCHAQMIEEMITHYQIPYWEDPTNQDQSYLRNHIRLQLIPKLQEVFGIGFEQRFAQSATFLNQSLLCLNHTLASQNSDQIKYFKYLISCELNLLDMPDYLQAHWLHHLILTAYERFRTDDHLNLRRVKDHIERLQALWHKEGTRQFKMELPYQLMLISQKNKLLIYDLRAFEFNINPIPIDLSRLEDEKLSVSFGIWRLEICLKTEKDQHSIPFALIKQRLQMQALLSMPKEGEIFKREMGHKKVRHIWGDIKASMIEREYLKVLYHGDELLYVPYLGVNLGYIEKDQRVEDDGRFCCFELSYL